MQSFFLGVIKQLTAPSHRNREYLEVPALHPIDILQNRALKLSGTHLVIYKTRALAEAEQVGKCPISHRIFGSIGLCNTS